MQKMIFFLIACIFVNIGKAQNWLTSGNAGTTPGTNFIGNTDAKDFVFKTNNLERGRIITAGGIWRFGTANDFVKIDSSGKLTLGGNGVFRIANNKYVFQNLSNNKIGLFYNSNIPQYEFRDGNAVPVFSINAANGNLQSQILSGTGYRTVFADASGNLTTSIPALPASEVTNATAQLIPDNNCAGAASTITFSGLPASVPSASVTVTLNVTHPALNNLTIYLVAPDGSIINLISGNLGGGNLVNTVFNDVGNSLSSGSNSYTGTFKPAGSLNPYTCSITGTVATFGAMGGGSVNPNGNWILKLYDITAGNSGTLNNWTISLNPGTSLEGVWGLNGNTGSTLNNFIGTRDKQSLRFKINNVNAGLIGIDGNVSLGIGALNKNIFSNGLVAIGDSALYNNTSVGNTAIGAKSLYSNTTGYNNTASGYNALYNNSTGRYNTAAGDYALYSNTTGFDNTAIGHNALYSANSFLNTAIGYYALKLNTSGSGNTAAGDYAQYSNTTGYSNTAAGDYALFSNTTGNQNTAFGAEANVTSGNLFNATAIGYYARVDASNKVVIGSTGVTSIGGYRGWTTYPSDGRFKKNVQQNVPGLAFINKLKPVTYNVDMEALEKTMDPEKQNNDSLENTAEQKKQKVENSKIIYSGFIVQDVEKAAKDLNYDFGAIDKTGKVWGLRYAEFVVPLVKAVQELSKINEEKDTKIDAQEKKIEAQQKQIDEMKTMLLLLQQNIADCNPCMQQSAINNQPGASGSYKSEAENIATALLEQNIPNPFNHTTIINYTLPQKFTAAYIIITDKTGKTLKQLNISGSGRGIITADASTLASGAYNYSLYVEGKLVATKQMVLVK